LKNERKQREWEDRRKMAWISERQIVTDEQKEELMGLGAMIVADIEKLIGGVSSAIRTEFRHGVTLAPGGAGTGPAQSAQIVLLFTITDLGGFDETKVKTHINDRLLQIIADRSKMKYKIQWGFEGKIKGGPEAPSADQNVKIDVPPELGASAPLPVEAPAPPAIGEPARDPVATEGIVHDSMNGVPASPTDPSGNGKGRKVPFVGVINGKKVSTEVSPEVVTQQDYDAHFVKRPSIEAFREGQELRRKLRDATGLVFDVQVQPTMPS
jgi:hypothetical protein